MRHAPVVTCAGHATFCLNDVARNAVVRGVWQKAAVLALSACRNRTLEAEANRRPSDWNSALSRCPGVTWNATAALVRGRNSRCQGLHNRAFLPYVEPRDTERSAAAFDRWFERAFLDRVALPGG